MWVVKDIAGSVGDGCVQALPDLGANINTDIAATSPHLAYEIIFTTTGTHYLWIRGVADNTAGDSVHYGLDGVVGRELVESYGGKVALAPHIEDQSSTATIKKIKSLEG